MYSQNYITAYGLSSKTTPVTLPAGTAVQLVAQDFNRHYLSIQVTGPNPATFGFGAAPPATGQGLSLDGAFTTGGQGGAYEFKDNIPSDSIWALSTLGTTVVIVEGF